MSNSIAPDRAAYLSEAIPSGKADIRDRNRSGGPSIFSLYNEVLHLVRRLVRLCEFSDRFLPGADIRARPENLFCSLFSLSLNEGEREGGGENINMPFRLLPLDETTRE